MSNENWDFPTKKSRKPQLPAVTEKKSLNDLISEASSIMEEVIENDGELTADLELIHSANEQALANKVETYGFVMDQFEMADALCEAKIAEWQARRAGLAKGRERMEDRLMAAMDTLGVEDLSGHDVTFYLQKNAPKVVVEDEALLDATYKVEKITVSIDKRKLSEDMKQGLPIPGVRLEQGRHLRMKLASPKAVKKVSGK